AARSVRSPGSAVPPRGPRTPFRQLGSRVRVLPPPVDRDCLQPSEAWRRLEVPLHAIVQDGGSAAFRLHHAANLPNGRAHRLLDAVLDDADGGVAYEHLLERSRQWPRRVRGLPGVDPRSAQLTDRLAAAAPRPDRVARVRAQKLLLQQRVDIALGG